MTHKQPDIQNNSIGPPASNEPFLVAIHRICDKNNQDKDVLCLFAYIQKRLDDENITSDTLADLLQNSFNHGLKTIADGTTSIPLPIAWIKWDCNQQIRKIQYSQRRDEA